MASKPQGFSRFSLSAASAHCCHPSGTGRQHADSTQAIPDGDTLSIHLDGSGAVRFLGIDTPEKAFDLAGQGRPALDHPRWVNYLSDPFPPAFGPFPLESALEAHLRARANPTAATNHHRHGEAARAALTQLVQEDLTALGQTPSAFRFFLSFSHEVFDTYGRFLAFINRNQPTGSAANPRPLTYNERLLEPARRRRISSGRTLRRSAMRPRCWTPSYRSVGPPTWPSSRVRYAGRGIRQGRADGRTGRLRSSRSPAIRSLRDSLSGTSDGAEPRRHRSQQERKPDPAPTKLLHDSASGGSAVHPQDRARLRGQGLAAGRLGLNRPPQRSLWLASGLSRRSETNGHSRNSRRRNWLASVRRGFACSSSRSRVLADSGSMRWRRYAMTRRGL